MSVVTFFMVTGKKIVMNFYNILLLIIMFHTFVYIFFFYFLFLMILYLELPLIDFSVKFSIRGFLFVIFFLSLPKIRADLQKIIVSFIYLFFVGSKLFDLETPVFVSSSSSEVGVDSNIEQVIAVIINVYQKNVLIILVYKPHLTLIMYYYFFFVQSSNYIHFLYTLFHSFIFQKILKYHIKPYFVR